MPPTDRRTLLGLTAGLVTTTGAAAQPAPQGLQPAGPALTVAMLVYPEMILLDLVGPQTVFNLLGAKVELVGRDGAPVRTDVGVSLAPTCTFADCPRDLDVLFVPGGLVGSVAAMDDPATTAFLAERGARARYVTSVCTGALVLGAAGLLQGYRATTHWYVRDLLPRLGATPVADRVVVDRNRVTGAGVTAGLDFGLTLAALLRSEADAKRIQLVIEYDPHPPFDAGSPAGAGPAMTEDVLKRRAPVLTRAASAADRAAQRLKA